MGRIVVVIGAIVSDVRYGIAESHLRMTTGRRFSGSLKVYQMLPFNHEDRETWDQAGNAIPPLYNL